MFWGFETNVCTMTAFEKGVSILELQTNELEIYVIEEMLFMEGNTCHRRNTYFGKEKYSLLYLECHFFFLKSHSII